MNRYQQWIEDQIAHHEKEIARLTIARNVMASVDKQYAKVRAKTLGIPKEFQQQLVQDDPDLGRPLPDGKLKKGDLQERIMLAMDRPKMTINEIHAAISSAWPDMTRSMTRNALSHAVTSGRAVRTGYGTYSPAEMKADGQEEG